VLKGQGRRNSYAAGSPARQRKKASSSSFCNVRCRHQGHKLAASHGLFLRPSRKKRKETTTLPISISSIALPRERTREFRGGRGGGYNLQLPIPPGEGGRGEEKRGFRHSFSSRPSHRRPVWFRKKKRPLRKKSPLSGIYSYVEGRRGKKGGYSSHEGGYSEKKNFGSKGGAALGKKRGSTFLMIMESLGRGQHQEEKSTSPLGKGEKSESIRINSPREVGIEKGPRRPRPTKRPKKGLILLGATEDLSPQGSKRKKKEGGINYFAKALADEPGARKRHLTDFRRASISITRSDEIKAHRFRRIRRRT